MLKAVLLSLILFAPLVFAKDDSVKEEDPWEDTWEDSYDADTGVLTYWNEVWNFCKREANVGAVWEAEPCVTSRMLLSTYGHILYNETVSNALQKSIDAINDASLPAISGKISDNTYAISTNLGSISTNWGAIQTNETAIHDNGVDISGNTESIDSIARIVGSLDVVDSATFLGLVDLVDNNINAISSLDSRIGALETEARLIDEYLRPLWPAGVEDANGTLVGLWDNGYGGKGYITVNLGVDGLNLFRLPVIFTEHPIVGDFAGTIENHSTFQTNDYYCNGGGSAIDVDPEDYLWVMDVGTSRAPQIFYSADSTNVSAVTASIALDGRCSYNRGSEDYTQYGLSKDSTWFDSHPTPWTWISADDI